MTKSGKVGRTVLSLTILLPQLALGQATQLPSEARRVRDAYAPTSLSQAFDQAYQAQVRSRFTSTMASGQGVLAQNQIHHGNFEALKFIQAGWHGYHIVSRVTKRRNWVDYSYKYTTTKTVTKSDGTTETQTSTETAERSAGPMCRNGDCEYFELSNIYKIASSEEQRGQRRQQETLIGVVRASDSGQLEQRLLQNPQGISILRIDEQEAQTALQWDEAQTQTFLAFDSNSVPRELGHIEEADAPWIWNQPESVYKRENGQDRFLTTVVERMIPILPTATADSEGMRKGTLWCNSNNTRNAGFLGRLFYSDSFDLNMCPNQDLPFVSQTKLRGRLLQSIVDRTDSRVQVRNPDNPSQRFNYEALSDYSFVRDNGTDYIGRVTHDRKEKNFFHWNSRRFNWGEMENCHPDIREGGRPNGRRNHRQDGKCNYPRAKLLTMNWDLNADFAGIPRSDNWLKDQHEETYGIVNRRRVEMASRRAALVSYERTGEIYTMANGQQCAEKEVDGMWGSKVRVYADDRLERLYDDDHNERSQRQLKLECQGWTTYNLHMYILFPSTVKSPNGQPLDEFNKLRLLDRVLAALPDQAQMSTELVVAEEMVDQIIALEKYHAARSPEVIDLETAVDIGTEEDHLTAQTKVWDLLGDVGLVPIRASRSNETLPTPRGAAPEPPQVPVQRDETQF